MGIAIHKRLGWALTDLQRTDGKITDPRVNTDAPVLNWEAPPVEEYFDHLRGRDDRGSSLDYGHLLHRREECARRHDLQDAVLFPSESDDPDILTITPLSCHNWTRRGDLIDEIDWHASHDTLDPEVTVQRGGIYPFIGSFMDRRTGAPLPHAVLPYLRAVARGDHPDVLEGDADAFGMTHAEASLHVAPAIPVDVRALATVLHLFTSDRVVLDLKPVLLTYWR